MVYFLIYILIGLLWILSYNKLIVPKNKKELGAKQCVVAVILWPAILLLSIYLLIRLLLKRRKSK